MNINIDDALIEKLQRLSGLELSTAEKNKLQGDLSDILNMVAKIDEYDLSDVEPLIHMSPVQHKLRPDKAKNLLSTEQALANAPKRKDNYIAIPKVVKKK